nr:putative toxin [Mycobacteroides saopaulense]
MAGLHSLYRAGDQLGELITWSVLLLGLLTALGGGIKLAVWGLLPVISAAFGAAKERVSEPLQAVIASLAVVAGALGMWWSFRGGYNAWWQSVTGERGWSLILGVGQMLMAVLAGAALFTGGKYLFGLAREVITGADGASAHRDQPQKNHDESVWHPGLVAALIGGGLGLVLLTAGIAPRLYVWITGPQVLPAVAAIILVLLMAIGSNLGWWKGLTGLWKWATAASQKATATAGVVAVLLFSAGGLGLGWFTPATVPQAHAACPPDCGGGPGGNDGPPGGGQMFQPPQMPQLPEYQGSNYGYPGLDQNNGVSIYNQQPGQGSPNEAGQQAFPEKPYYGTQARNGESLVKPDYAPPQMTGQPGQPQIPNPDYQGGQANSGDQGAPQQQQPAQNISQQPPQNQPPQQNMEQPNQSDQQRIDDLTRQLQQQQQQSGQDRQRIDDLTKQLQQQNKQNQKQQQLPRFPSKDKKQDEDQQKDRDKQSQNTDLVSLLLGVASSRRRKEDDQQQPQQQQKGPDTQALAQDGVQAAQGLPGDIQTYVQSGQQIGESSGQAAQGFGSAAQAGASLASSAQSGAVNPQDAITLVQGISQGVQGTADAVNAGSQIVETAQGEADQVAQAVGDANPQLKPQMDQARQLNQQAGQLTDLVGQGSQLTSQGAGAVNTVSSLGTSGMPDTSGATDAPTDMVGWATATSGPTSTGPAASPMDFGGPLPRQPAPADPTGGEAPIEDQLVPLIAGQPVKIDQAVKFRTASGAPSPDLFAFGTGTFLPVADTETGPAILTWGYQGMGPTKVLNQTTEIWVNGEQVQPQMLLQNNVYTLTIPAINDGDTFVFKQHLTIQWQEGNVTREATGTLDGWLQPQNSPGTNTELSGISSGAKGRQGMAAVGLKQNVTPIYPNSSAKKYRVPDVLLDSPIGILGEVKNVKYQGLTTQLTEYMNYAKANGYVFHLFVRQGEGTQLSQELQNQIAAGNIILHKVI